VNGCFVSGNLQKNFAVSAGAQTRSYEVGSATATLVAYAPVSITLANVTTAGNVVVSSTAGDHPNIGSSALDASKSANRYWTIANSGTVFGALAGNSVTFNFVAADLDAMATPANFNVGRYTGSWTVTPPPTPTRTATSTTIAGTTITTAALPGAYAVAETGVTVGTPGNFNTFETSTAPNPGAIVGFIKTKIAGAAFSLDVVAIASGTQMTLFGGNVKVELLANSGGGYGADNCPTASSLVQTIASAAIAGGRSTVNFAAVADAYRDVRVRVSYPAASPTVASCSTDSFAIRPNAFVNFSVTDNDAQNPGTGRTLGNVTFSGGAVVHKAGRAFTVRSDAVNAAATPAITTNYTGAPSVTLTACGASAPCTPGFGTLTLDTTHAAGQLASNAASYNQVGSFTAQLVDTSFASIDAADGSTLAERTIQSSAIDVGRFVPDHFAVALNAPVFQTACEVGGFTYVGQSFGYTSTVPVITVTAQDAANNTTTFYAGSWWRITNASLAGESYSAATGALDASGIPGTDPVVAQSGAGVGTLTFDSGTGLFFSRAGVVAPFAANVSLSINVLDADGVAATVNPVVFAGIQFSTGTAIRYGRVRLSTAVGSELVDLPVKMVAEYHNGAASGFVTNADDACTSGVSLALSAYTKNLSAGETCVRDGGSPGASGAGCPAAAPAGQRFQEPPVLGDFNLRLAAPGAGNNGSVKITATVPTWLQYDWDASTPGDESPTGTATFGVFGGRSQQIYTREIY
jgi:MSHA biogenesis protein MshQ